MWLSQAAYLKQVEDNISLRIQRDQAVALAKQQETTLAWFMHRLTQVEQERSKLIQLYTGVKVEAPIYEPSDPTKDGASMLQQNPLNALPSFNDVGDEEARRLGIDWTPEGTLLFGVTK